MAERKRLEEVEKVAKDLQGALHDVTETVDALEGAVQSLETTVAGHSDKLDVIMEKLEEIALVVKKRPSRDSDASSTGGGHTHADSSVGAVLAPRMDLPIFDGGDPLPWLAQAEQYFLVNKTEEAMKVQLALIAMSGNAMFWAQWVLRRAAAISWPDFSKELVARFGDSSAVNAYEALHLTRQTGSLEDYLSLFESRVAQLPSLPPEQYLGVFLGGLKSSIRDRLPDLEVQDVFATIRAARRIAHSARPSGMSYWPSFST